MNVSIVFFYSKYSQSCHQCESLLKQADLEYQSLCIDNSTVRKIITKDNKYKIKKMPCFLLFYSNGEVEKIEGIQCHLWIKNIIYEQEEEEKKQQQQQEKQIQQLSLSSQNDMISLPFQSQPFQTFTNDMNIKSIDILGHAEVISSPIPVSISSNHHQEQKIDNNHNDENVAQQHIQEEEEEDLTGMKRRLDSTPLIKKPKASLSETEKYWKKDKNAHEYYENEDTNNYAKDGNNAKDRNDRNDEKDEKDGNDEKDEKDGNDGMMNKSKQNENSLMLLVQKMQKERDSMESSI